jgi:hypothetical protein
MFGIVTLAISVLSIAWPFCRTIQTLENIYTSQSTPMATLTDSITMPRKTTIQLQEIITYWMALSVWLYLLNVQPLASVVKYLPLSSFLVLYVQIWLGVPMVPAKDPTNGAVTKVTGASVIYHYFFDNNMANLSRTKGMLLHDVGMIGAAVCRSIKLVPSSAKVFAILGIDLESYLNMFNAMANYGTTSPATNSRLDGGAVSHTMNNVAQLWGLVYSTTHTATAATSREAWRPLPTAPPSYDDVNGIATLSLTDTIVQSLLAPLRYVLFDAVANSESSHDDSGVNLASSRNGNPNAYAGSSLQNTSTNPSPTRSFDGFDIVNKGDIPHNGGELNDKMQKRRSHQDMQSQGTPASDYDDSETTGLLKSVKRVASGASATASTAVNRRSSWFRSSSRG